MVFYTLAKRPQTAKVEEEKSEDLSKLKTLVEVSDAKREVTPQ